MDSQYLDCGVSNDLRASVRHLSSKVKRSAGFEFGRLLAWCLNHAALKDIRELVTMMDVTGKNCARRRLHYAHDDFRPRYTCEVRFLHLRALRRLLLSVKTFRRRSARQDAAKQNECELRVRSQHFFLPLSACTLNVQVDAIGC
jgi:hypothetical protein